MSPVPFRGVLPAAITPFKDGKVDTAGIAHNLSLWNKTGLSGYLFLGSTGEFVHLEEKERDQVIATAREHTPPSKWLVVGTGDLSTARAVRFTRRAAELGADAALVIAPFYYRRAMHVEALKRHFDAVADAATIPVMVYNVPPFTGVNLEPETVARLAEHPNIVGMKDSAGDVGQLSALLRMCPPGFAVFTGAARVLHAAFVTGVAGAMLALANVASTLCVAMEQLVRADRHVDARVLQTRLTELEAAITSTPGGGGWKAAMDLAGFRGGEPRSPLLPASPAAIETIRGKLAELGLLAPPTPEP